jgi:hypothetical protein
MRLASILSSIVAFILFNPLGTITSNAAVDLTEREITGRVTKLINSKRSVHIQGIKIEEVDQDQLNLEINANVGNCWGKKEYAKRFARQALKALYTSELPIHHVIVNVFESDEILLTVALGKNQATHMNWDEGESLNAFYEHIKSRMNYKGNPADSCWLIEKK